MITTISSSTSAGADTRRSAPLSDRQPRAHHRAGARPAVDVEGSVDRGDAVAQALEAGAGAEVRAADAVVADLDVEVAVAPLDVDPGAARAARTWRRW